MLPRNVLLLLTGGGLGPELVVNGDFTAWTLGDPDGWSVTEVPPTSEIRESVGGGQCVLERVSATPRIQQTILTVGKRYFITFNLVSITGGTLQIADASAGINQQYTTAGLKSFTGTAGHPILRVQQITAGVSTIDDFSCKLVL